MLLREWQKEDALTLAKIANNINIAKNLRNTFPYPYTLEDALWYINDCCGHEGHKQITRAIIIDGKVAGSIGVFIKDDVYEKSGELGYWLAEEYWGQGIMSEAVQQICQKAFDTFDIVRIYAEPFAYNQGSCKVLEKNGFIYEGTMKNGVYKNDRFYDYCMYALLKDDVKRSLDAYSYQCGVIDCFNEMVKAGVKTLALAHPCSTQQQRDSYIPFVEEITKKYQTFYYLDDDPLITDLFPYSLNKNTYNILFYKDEQYIQRYQALKEKKKQAIDSHQYHQLRKEIAYEFGDLLHYSDETIQRYIDSNQEKENDEGQI